jgi:hypothetical protein
MAVRSTERLASTEGSGGVAATPKYLLFIILLLGCLTGQAQQASISPRLWVELQQSSHLRKQSIPCLVKGPLELVQTETAKLGGRYKYGLKNIHALNLTGAAILKLRQVPGIERIEAELRGGVVFNESVRANCHADSVHLGLGILPRSFKGSGVVLGIIDTDLGFEHGDFKNADGSTRVAYIWDQASSASPNVSYGYGFQWDANDINGGVCTYSAGNAAHGSQVTGIAAGNGLQVGKHAGIAPETDIVFVRIKLDDNFFANFVDAVHYIFQQAEAMGKACSINSSVGDYYGSHDATDLFAQMVENLLDEAPGRFLAQAAGNARGFKLHLKPVLTGNNTQSTWFAYNNTRKQFEFFGFADTTDFKQVNFSLDYIDRTSYANLGSTQSFNIQTDFNLPPGGLDSVVQVLFYTPAGQPVTLKIYAAEYAGVYELWFRIIQPTTQNYWQLNSWGTGTWDIWSSAAVFGSSNIVQNPPVLVANYQNPDNQQSIVSSWACSDHVLTVGSYNNLASFVNWAGDTMYAIQLYNDTSGYISDFSSRGPTRDGRVKPDITAPGGVVLSSIPLSLAQSMQNSNNQLLAQEGYHSINGGTSMASPSVAGTAALYFECQPDATWLEVKQAILSSARNDSLSLAWSPMPNIDWGYGKLNTYQSVVQCLVFGCMDSLAVNFNPNANVDDGSCTFVAVQTIPQPSGAVSVWPNPSTDWLNIDYDLEESKPLVLNILDASGRLVLSRNLNGAKGTEQLQVKNWAPGAYIYQLKSAEEVLETGKFVVQ